MPLTTGRQTTKENAKKAKEMKRELVTMEIACKVGEKHFYYLSPLLIIINTDRKHVFIRAMLATYNNEIIIR